MRSFLVCSVLALTLVACGDDDDGSSDAMAMCSSARDCADPTPLCAAGRCVQCVVADQCDDGELCLESVCVPDDVRSCTTSADCPSDRPICQATATGGVCVGGCETDGDCVSGSCIEGACVECLAEAGTVLPTDACGCDADCAGTDAVCAEGVCTADCEETGCPEGLLCEGAPAECVTCEADTRAEGATCGCDDQCAGALDCIGGFCSEACDFDETCGDGECGHEVAVPASCRPADEACFGAGDGALGEECSCNRDCAIDAPFCVGFFAGGDRGFVCSDVCGAEDPCPAGFECCGASGARHCLTATLAEAAGVACD
ncbi:MAG: hypothetical protein JJ863_29860 [Deltaproteobacteria bacterium]|nr:hypothetical protein [Deltaproteobacteria bacterium]